MKEARSLFGCGPQVLAVSAKSCPRGSGFSFEISGSFLSRSTAAAHSSYFETHGLDGKIVLRGDLALQSLEGGAVKLLDLPAMEASQMQMIFLGLDLVIMLFAVEVHQIQLINQSQAA